MTQQFVVRITCENALLSHDNPNAPDEIEEILDRLRLRIAARGFTDMDAIKLLDSNGNTVGTAGMECV